MRALSPYDPDAAFSLRPDHQWNGAYPAWPADVRAPRCSRSAAMTSSPDWLPGLAESTNQGPLGQAHFVEEAVDRRWPAARGSRRRSSRT